MQIKTHFCVSVDGFISTPDGWPAQLTMPAFAGRESYGLPEFLATCSAAVMGRTTFLPALGAPDWPWPGLQVFVLTSSALPAGSPDGVVTAGDPAELVELMRAANLAGDVHLVGGQRTLDAFLGIGAIGTFGVVTLPILIGSGVRLSAADSPQRRLRLESSRTFADGAVEHLYALEGAPG